MAICGEDDVHVTEEVYKRPLFLQPTYRYHGAALSPGPMCWPWVLQVLLSSCSLSFTICRLGRVPPTHVSHGGAHTVSKQCLGIGSERDSQSGCLPNGLLSLTWQVPPPASARARESPGGPVGRLCQCSPGKWGGHGGGVLRVVPTEVPLFCSVCVSTSGWTYGGVCLRVYVRVCQRLCVCLWGVCVHV